MFCVLSCNHGIDVVFESNLYIDSDRQCISYSVEIFVIFGTWPSWFRLEPVWFGLNAIWPESNCSCNTL